jgi:hypothetical protein
MLDKSGLGFDMLSWETATLAVMLNGHKINEVLNIIGLGDRHQFLEALILLRDRAERKPPVRDHFPNLIKGDSICPSLTH